MTIASHPMMKRRRSSGFSSGTGGCATPITILTIADQSNHIGDPSCFASFLLTYTGIGAGIGALAGAIRNHANRDDDTIYVAGVRTTTVTFAPILSRSRKGAAMSVTWR